MDAKTCFLLVIHGSNHPLAHTGTARFREVLAARRLPWEARLCFLRLSEPTLQGELEVASQKGFGRIVVFPLLVFPGQHLVEEIPAILDRFRQAHPGLAVELLPPMADLPSFGDWLEGEMRARITAGG